MIYTIIAMSMVDATFYPIRSFGFETYEACQTFINDIIVIPESNMIYGCFVMG
jgi:hypothetical protein